MLRVLVRLKIQPIKRMRQLLAGPPDPLHVLDRGPLLIRAGSHQDPVALAAVVDLRDFGEDDAPDAAEEAQGVGAVLGGVEFDAVEGRLKSDCGLGEDAEGDELEAVGGGVEVWEHVRPDERVGF